MSAIVSNVHASRTFKATRTVAISSDTLGIIYQFGGKRPLATRQAMFVEHIWSWAKCRALAPNIYLKEIEKEEKKGIAFIQYHMLCIFTVR